MSCPPAPVISFGSRAFGQLRARRCSSSPDRSSSSASWTDSSWPPSFSSVRSCSGLAAPLLLAGVALSGGSALGVGLAVFAAPRPAGVQRLARRLPARVGFAASDFVAGLSSFRDRRVVALGICTSACIWLANLVLYGAVGLGLGLDTGVGAYLSLEAVGNLALAVPGTAAGVGSFDYLTLMAARSLAIPRDGAAAYVIAVHALTVVPVTVLGLLLIGRAVSVRPHVPAVESA